MYQRNSFRQIVEDAIDAFIAREQYLIENDLSERCVCARFAPYLERQLAQSGYFGYVVDVEYNRGKDGRSENRKSLDGHNIVVDLIAHKRGFSPEFGFINLICIEMKKAPGGRGIAKDKDRLCKLTDSCNGFNYEAGFMILICRNIKHGEFNLRIESEFSNGRERMNPNDVLLS